MKIRKILAGLAAAVLVGTAGTLAVQAPAQAALSDCTNYSGVFCLWKNGGQGGSIWRQTVPGQVSYSCTPLTNWTGWNDTVTSFRNQARGYIMELYWTNTCTGTPIEAAYGLNYDLTGNTWDNEISGIAWRHA